MALDEKPTPVLTDHARQRCAEMGISTKVAKAIVRHPSIRYQGKRLPGGSTTTIHISDVHPGYLAVVADDDGSIVTVGFHTPGKVYVREGKTYRIVA